ncbi:phage tail tube protein [Frigidibacter sp. MR17.24]|uniref:phage tail tube protein n=1 Tax=Frigidibacter sp. MR17.24 TaxID=3127345 RepID=UPI003012A2E1
MAAPVTAKFEHLVLEIETETPGTYAKMCGLMDFTISRASQVDTVETPQDCDDESLPYQTERSVRALDVQLTNVSAVWAQQSHQAMMDWFYSSSTKNIRIQHVNAAVGDTEYEAGAALLTQLDHQRTKGQKITATVSIQFDGTPTRTAKVAP